MGMELAYKRMPHKKWYAILDDDTFVVRESLELLLGRLDPGKAWYLGNAVGDYKARFAHGGSGVLISGEAMRMLFGRGDVVREAYVRSLDEVWGDRLVARTLLRMGVYLDERFSHYFNGEAPDLTRIRADGACSPIVSFHGLRTPGAMVKAARALGRMKEPVLWGQLWGLFGRDALESYGEESTALRDGHDHVGPGGEEEVRVWRGIKTAQDCQRKCRGTGRGTGGCLAWTYYTESRECRGSPWFIVGSPRTEVGTVSGINWSGARAAFHECSLSG